MKIVCVPVAEDLGLRSPVFDGFASAPMFLLVDSATFACRGIPNSAERRKERGCDPCGALEDTPVDLLIVSLIEPDALGRLAKLGVPVHGGARGTAADALTAYLGGRLVPLHPEREPFPAVRERMDDPGSGTGNGS